MALLALLVAVGWGAYSRSRPAAPRSQDMTIPVSLEWHQTLPSDPALAAQAYLDRVPAPMRARGEAVSDTRYWIWGARIVLTIGAMTLFLFSGAAGALSNGVTRISRLAWLQALVFAAAVFVYLFAALLPVEVYAGYVRPRTFGFADRSFWAWLQDHVLNWAVLSAFYAVGVAAFTTLMRRKPQSWAGWATLVYFSLATLYVLATPGFIEPMFNTYTALPDSPIKRDILAMAHANGLSADNVYTADASRQSRLLNAHVSGVFGTARISIDDTTLSEQYRPSILAVVGHEIGHHVMGHVFSFVVVLTTVAGLGFALIAWAAPLLIRRFRAHWKIGDLRETGGIAVFWLLFLIWGFVSDPITKAFSRWQEAQADIYGLNASQAPDGMAEFMIHDADTARLSPTPLDILLFYDHPSDRSRIETAMRWRAAHISTNEPE